MQRDPGVVGVGVGVGVRRSASPLGVWRIISTGVLLGACAIILLVGFLTATTLDLYAWDFRGQYLGGARAVVAGEPLYDSPSTVDLDNGHPYVYPPPLAVAVVPLTVFSDDVAMVLAMVGSLVAAFAALALVGVRDVRCYAATLASAPAWTLLETANVTALLALGLALAWRSRATVWPLAAVLGLSLATKLFLWPLVAWTLLTRRYGVSLRAVLVAALAVFGTWALVGFQGLRDYPELLRKLEQRYADESYSMVGMTSTIGMDPALARVLIALTGGALLVACWRFARGGDDARAFTCAIFAALALTPISWIHYVWFALVPLGIMRPRFSALWLLPLVLWAAPHSGNGDGLQPYVPAAVLVVLFVALVASRSPSRRISESLA